MNIQIKKALGLTLVAAALVAAMTPSLPAGAADKPYVFTTIDFPGSALTQALGINAEGDIVGTYKNSATADNKNHGFVLRGGEFTAINSPFGANYTIATAIGPTGDIVGYYESAIGPAGNSHGFVLTNEGQWMPVEYPGGHLMTGPFRILPDGTIVGCVHDLPLPAGMHGFVIGPKGISLFDQPASMHMGATPNGKTIVGYYTAANTTGGYGTGARTRGYVLDDGDMVPFDVKSSKLTQAMDINPAGVVAGLYTDLAGTTHGFLVKTSGLAVEDWEYTTIDVPGATLTRIRGIDASGDIVGDYIGTDGRNHGFLASRTSK